MLSAPPAVRAQLSEALTIISAHDFPADWQALLPDLITRLQAAEAGEVRGVLETANAIYKRYRSQFMSDALSAELQYSQQLVGPLLAVLQRLTAQARPTGHAMKGPTWEPGGGAVHASEGMRGLRLAGGQMSASSGPGSSLAV